MQLFLSLQMRELRLRVNIPSKVNGWQIPKANLAMHYACLVRAHSTIQQQKGWCDVHWVTEYPVSWDDVYYHCHLESLNLNFLIRKWKQ